MGFDSTVEESSHSVGSKLMSSLPSASGQSHINSSANASSGPTAGAQTAQQQLLPLMSFGPPFVMPANSGAGVMNSNSGGGSGGGTTASTSAAAASSLAHIQQGQREVANHNNHSGHTHAIQLQTSLEMGPVVCPALCEIRTQLQELTRSVESCHNEVSTSNRTRDFFRVFSLVVSWVTQIQVSDIKRDMSTMRHEVESIHNVKEEMDDLRECIDKLQEQNRRRKLRLLEQVFQASFSTLVLSGASTKDSFCCTFNLFVWSSSTGHQRFFVSSSSLFWFAVRCGCVQNLGFLCFRSVFLREFFFFFGGWQSGLNS